MGKIKHGNLRHARVVYGVKKTNKPRPRLPGIGVAKIKSFIFLIEEEKTNETKHAPASPSWPNLVP